MDDSELWVAVREVVARPDEWGEEGEVWLWHANPDEAHLDVDALTEAIVDILTKRADVS